jgi:hypothetical protein
VSRAGRAQQASARRPPGFALAYAALFGALTSALLAALFLAARSGLPTPAWLVPGCLALFGAFAFAPFALPARARAACLRAPSLAACASLLVLASPAALLATGPGAAALIPLAALLGLGRALPHLRGIRGGEAALLAAGPLLLAPYLFASVYPFPFSHAFRPEHAALDTATGDEILHAALAHLIQSAGRATSGLDGFVPIHYHLGSHAWFAGLGLATGAAPLVAQPAGMLIAVVPALYTSLFFAVACLAPAEAGVAGRIVAALALVFLFDRIGWDAYYASESQALGLCAVLLALPSVRDLAAFAPERRAELDPGRALGALAGVAIAAAAKISAGAVLAAAFAWACLRRHGLSLRSAALLAPLAAVALAAGLSLAPRAGVPGPGLFAPLDFYRRFDPFARSGEELLDPRKAHSSLLLPLAFAATSLLSRSRRRASRREPARRRGADAVELVLVATLAALVPGLAVALAHDAWWFQNTAQWIALAFAAAELPVTRPEGATAQRRGAPVHLACLALCGLVAAGLAAARIRELPRRFGTPVDLLVAVAGPEPPGWRRLAARPLADLLAALGRGGILPDGLARRIESSPMARIALLVEAAKTGLEATRLAVYVPPEHAEFWRPDLCHKRPFLIPALSGVPMLLGVPGSCGTIRSWGAFCCRDYGGDSTLRRLDAPDLCRHAARRGIESVFVLRSLSEPERNEILRCGPAPAR